MSRDKSLNQVSINFLDDFTKLENNENANDILKIGMWISYYQPINKKKYFRKGGWLHEIFDDYLIIKRFYKKPIEWKIQLKSNQEQKAAIIYYRDVEKEKNTLAEFFNLTTVRLEELNRAIRVFGGQKFIENAKLVEKHGTIENLLTGKTS